MGGTLLCTANNMERSVELGMEADNEVTNKTVQKGNSVIEKNI